MIALHASEFTNRSFRALLAALCFIAASAAVVAAGDGAEAAPPYGAQVSTLASQLGAQVKSIADSNTMSRAKREQWIATAVRVSVVAATAYDNDPGQALAAAIRVVSAAVRAAPGYAEVIVKAASFAPTVTRIAGATGQIRSAAYAAASGRPYRRPAPAAAIAENDLPQAMTDPAESAYPENPRARLESPTYANPNFSADSGLGETPTGRGQSRVNVNQNSAIHTTLDLSVQRNDNVFLTSTNPIITTASNNTTNTVIPKKVADTILSATPGIELSYGQHSLSSGSLALHESIAHYTGHSSPDAHTPSLAGELAYAGDRVKTAISGSYQQSFQQNNADLTAAGKQNNADLTAAGVTKPVRTDALSFGGRMDSDFTGKLGGDLGVDYSSLEYKDSILTGNKVVTIPANLLYKLDSLVSLSTGLSYGRTTPTGTGPTSTDMYYNVGAQGEFTPKLHGNFSIGYRTRRVPVTVPNTDTTKPATTETSKEGSLGFDGKFTYQATDKTSANLSLSQNFGSSALGQSTKTTSYAFQLANTFSSQFSLSASTQYRRTNIGLPVFAPLTDATKQFVSQRVDNGWENSLQATYLFTNWLTMVGNYTFRNNRSNQDTADYDNNVFSLTLGLQY